MVFTRRQCYPWTLARSLQCLHKNTSNPCFPILSFPQPESFGAGFQIQSSLLKKHIISFVCVCVAHRVAWKALNASADLFHLAVAKVLFCCSLKGVKRASYPRCIAFLSCFWKLDSCLDGNCKFMCIGERRILFTFHTGAIASMQGAFRNPVLSTVNPSGNGTFWISSLLFSWFRWPKDFKQTFFCLFPRTQCIVLPQKS